MKGICLFVAILVGLCLSLNAAPGGPLPFVGIVVTAKPGQVKTSEDKSVVVDNTNPCSDGNAKLNTKSGAVETGSGFGGSVSGSPNVTLGNGTGTPDCKATVDMPGGTLTVSSNVWAEGKNTSSSTWLKIVPAGGSAVWIPPGGPFAISPN